METSNQRGREVFFGKAKTGKGGIQWEFHDVWVPFGWREVAIED